MANTRESDGHGRAGFPSQNVLRAGRCPWPSHIRPGMDSQCDLVIHLLLMGVAGTPNRRDSKGGDGVKVFNTQLTLYFGRETRVGPKSEVYYRDHNLDKRSRTLHGKLGRQGLPSAGFLSCIGVPIRASHTFRDTFLQPYLRCARERDGRSSPQPVVGILDMGFANLVPCASQLGMHLTRCLHMSVDICHKRRAGPVFSAWPAMMG